MRALFGFELAYSHLRAGVGRIALSLLAVALGVALIVAMRSMNTAVMASFIASMDEMVGRTSLTIASGDGLPFPEGDLVAELERIPGVQHVFPLVTAVAFTDDADETKRKLLMVQGLPLNDREAIAHYHSGNVEGIIEDEDAFLNSRNGIIVGHKLAQERHLGVHDTLRLITPAGVRRFEVFGVLPEAEAGLERTLSGRIIVMNLLAAEDAFTELDLVNRIDVRVFPGEEKTVRNAIQAALKNGLTVEEPEGRKNIFRTTVGAFQGMMDGFAVLVCIAGFVISYSRLAAIFEARMWEIGLLRSVGLRRSVVFVELLKESLLLGIAGVAIGIPLGLFAAKQALPFMAGATALAAGQPEPTATFAVTLEPVMVGLLVGLGASLLSAVVPALRLARRQPIAALTSRGRDLPAESSSRWVVPIVLTALGVLLAVVQMRVGGKLLGTVATVALVVASCVAARPIVQRGSRVLGNLWGRWFGPVGELACAHVGQQSHRTGMTAATLALGTSVVLLFFIFQYSFERSVVRRLGERTRADIIVRAAAENGGYNSAPVTEKLVDDIAQVDGGVAVAGQARRPLGVGEDEYLDGFDPPCFVDEQVCSWQLESGSWTEARRRILDGTGAIISSALALHLGKTTGDTLTLPSPTGPWTLDIVGTTRADLVKSVIVSRPTYVAKTNDHTVTWIYVKAAPLRTSEVADALVARYAEKYRLRVDLREMWLDYFKGEVQRAFSAAYVLDVTIALLVMVGIGDLLATAVLERRGLLAMMRAVGLRRLSAFRALVLEAAAIGTFGIVLGAVLGTVLGLFWVKVQFPAVLGFALDVYVPRWLPLVGLGMWLICLGAAVIPGIQAARVPIAAHLRNE
jgi:putative ABC transport system permease protein